MEALARWRPFWQRAYPVRGRIGAWLIAGKRHGGVGSACPPPQRFPVVVYLAPVRVPACYVAILGRFAAEPVLSFWLQVTCTDVVVTVREMLVGFVGTLEALVVAA